MDNIQESKYQGGIVDFLYKLWWIKLPLKVNKISHNSFKAMMDGYYLTLWKPIAAFLPALLFIIGFFWGWKDWGGIYHVFTESKTLILVIITIGALSSNLGIMFLVGFILGDFFLDDHFIGNIHNKPLLWRLILINVPLIIKYSLLWMVLVFMPAMTKGLVLQLKLPRKLSLKTNIIIGATFNVLLTGGFIYYWAQIAAFIVRPLFTWQGASLYTQTFVYLQEETMTLVYMAMFVVAIRMWIQSLTVFNPKFKAAIDGYETDLLAEEVEPPKSIKINPWVRVSLYIAWTLLLISGLFSSLKEAIILAAFLFLIYGAQRNLIPLPIDPWRKLINKVPLILRLFITFIFIYYSGKYVVLESWQKGGVPFRPMVVMAGLAIFFFFVFNPGKPKAESNNPTL